MGDCADLLANTRQIRRRDAVQFSTPDDAAGARALQRAAKQGTLLRLGGRVYVLNGNAWLSNYF